MTCTAFSLWLIVNEKWNNSQWSRQNASVAFLDLRCLQQYLSCMILQVLRLTPVISMHLSAYKVKAGGRIHVLHLASAAWVDPRDVHCPLCSQGKSVSLTNFFRIARNTMTMCFNKEPGAAEVEVSRRLHAHASVSALVRLSFSPPAARVLEGRGAEGQPRGGALWEGGHQYARQRFPHRKVGTLFKVSGRWFMRPQAPPTPLSHPVVTKWCLRQSGKG